MLPKITVCVPTYDRYNDLENLIRSYLSLTYEHSSLLILDDLGSPKIEEVVSRYATSDPRIIYHKNKQNLGFIKNMRQGVGLVSEGILFFMGDDDIFIDTNALSYVATAFSDPRVGVAKCSHIIHRNGQITQAHSSPKDGEKISIYNNPEQAMEHVLFEAQAISGLIFRVNKEMQSLVSDSSTSYPHTELAFRTGLLYKSARIHAYLVGIQSYAANQANTISYTLAEGETNMLKDWIGIYERTHALAGDRALPFVPRKDFIERLTTFLITFYPYITLNSGKRETFRIIQESVKKNTFLLLAPFFYISTLTSLLLPRSAMNFVLGTYKKYKLRTILTKNQIEHFNDILARYY